MTRALTVGSLFSGIGGIDLGLQRAGFEIKWQVEIDGYCQKVLAKHWPDVARYGDIRTVGKHNLAPIDLIAGGFPCQDISNAGRRAGIDGERSGLWTEFYRIICELRPSFVLVENVAALLGRGFDQVLGDLAACGYDAEWQVLSAESVGAPHLRERVFIVAYPQRSQWWQSKPFGDVPNRQNAQWQEASSRLRASSENGRKGILAYTTGEGLSIRRQSRLTPHETQARAGMEYQFERCGKDVADPDRQSLAVGQVFGSYAAKELTTFKRSCSTGAGQWTTESRLDRVANGVPHRVDRLKGLGNAVVPQIAEYIGRCIMHAISQESEVVA